MNPPFPPPAPSGSAQRSAISAPFPAVAPARRVQPALASLPAPFATRARSAQAAAARENVCVLSGHGEFSKQYLEAADGKESNYYLVVPQGVRITFYAPHGAALENDVANRIERGDYPANAELQVKQKDGAGTKAHDCPQTYAAGARVINYTLCPPGNLSVVEGANVVTVLQKTSLKTLLDGVKRPAHVHWAACGSAYVDAKDRDHFPGWGYYCRLV